MLKIKYEIFRHASYVTDRSFQEMRELHVIQKKYGTTLITSLSVILTTIKMFLFSVFRLLL